MRKSLIALFLTLTLTFVGVVHITHQSDLKGAVTNDSSSVGQTKGMSTAYFPDNVARSMWYPGLGTFTVLDKDTIQARILFTSEQKTTQMVWRQLVWSETDPGEGRVRVFLNWWGQLMRIQSTTTGDQNLTTRVIVDVKKDGSPLGMSGSVVRNKNVIRNYVFSKTDYARSEPVTCKPFQCPSFHAAPTTIKRTPLVSVRIPSVDTDGTATVVDSLFYANIGRFTIPADSHSYTFDWDSKTVIEESDLSAGKRTVQWKDVRLTATPENGFSQIFGNYYGRPVDITETIATPSGKTETAYISYPQFNSTVVKLTDPDLKQIYETSGGYAMFNAAIEKVRTLKAGILDFDGGTYLIEPPADLGPSDVLAEISNVQDLLVEGRGGQLQFRSMRTGLSIGSATTTTNRIHLRNFSIDWADPMAFKGKIEQIPSGAESGTYLILDDPQLSRLPQAPEKLTVIADYSHTAKRWGAMGNGTRRMVDITYVTEPENGPLLYGTQVPGKYRYKLQQAIRWIPNGTTVVATQRTPKGALQVKAASNVTMENISIYASPTIGFLGNGAGNGFRVVNSRVTRNPSDPNRLVSTLGDGIHLIAQGNVFIENNLVESQGDDGLNVKGLFGRLSFVNPDRTLIQSNDNTVPMSIGDPILFADAATLKPLGTFAITKKVQKGIDGCPSTGANCIRFAEPLPETVAVETLMSNMNFKSTPFVVRGNTFRNSRARGALLHTGPGIFEDNTMTGLTHGGVWLITETTHYALGPGPSDVIVRNNTIANVGFWTDQRLQSSLNPQGSGVLPMAGILVEPRVELNGNPEVGVSPERVFSDILIEGNTISDVPGLGLFVSSTKNLSIIGNTMTNTNRWSFLPNSLVSKAVTIMFSSNAVIKDNDVPNGIYVDPNTTDNMYME